MDGSLCCHQTEVAGGDGNARPTTLFTVGMNAQTEYQDSELQTVWQSSGLTSVDNRKWLMSMAQLYLIEPIILPPLYHYPFNTEATSRTTEDQRKEETVCLHSLTLAFIRALVKTR